LATLPKPEPQEFPDKTVTEDALRRLKEARDQKSDARLDLQEALFFCRPRLAYEVQSSTASPKSPRNNNTEDALATGIGSEVSEDFATEVIAAFFPHGADWAESELDSSQTVGIEDYALKDVKDAAKARDKQVFSAIRASNFEAVLGTSLDPHAAVGTIAYWIDKPFNTRPIEVQHVPPRQLEFNVGPDGKVNDRFRVRWIKAPRIREIIGDIALPAEVQKRLNDKKNTNVEVAWGYWRDPDAGEDERWVSVLIVDKTVVKRDMMVGSEACVPLIVMRFSPDAECSWGFGPAMKALQDLRVLDAVTAATQDRVDVAVNPPIYYPDDGVMDFEGGLEAGRAYPMRVGSGRDIGSLYFGGDANLGFYTAADLEKRIRRKFFADYPEQTGKTPPTATQWVDQMLMAQRRIGTPGALFWLEGPYAIFRRFEWILEKDGKIAPIKLPNGQALTLTPRNPATQAQDQQKLQTASNLLGLIKNFFPETSQAAIDEAKTIENMKSITKDEVIVIRNEAVLGELIKTVLGAAGGGGQGGGMPTGGQQ
jgi:hypothetical protein